MRSNGRAWKARSLFERYGQPPRRLQSAVPSKCSLRGAANAMRWRVRLPRRLHSRAVIAPAISIQTYQVTFLRLTLS